MNVIVETNALISLHWYATTATGPFMIWRRSIYYYSMLFVVYNAYIHTHTWFFISNELFPQTYIICSAPANLLHGIWNNWSHIDREPLPSGFFSVRTWPDDIIKLLACFYCLYISFCNHIMHAVLPAIRIKIDRVLRLPCMWISFCLHITMLAINVNRPWHRQSTLIPRIALRVLITALQQLPIHDDC